MTRKGVTVPLPSLHYFHWVSITMRWGRANPHWWTHLTQSPRWRSSGWVDVVRSISSRRQSLWCSSKEEGGKGQGWGHSSPGPLLGLLGHTLAIVKCTTCESAAMHLTHTRYLHIVHILELGKHSISLSVLFQNNPKQAEMSGPYRGKRSPRAECRKTRRRSVWCRGCRRCSREPSTSPGERSAGKRGGR